MVVEDLRDEALVRIEHGGPDLRLSGRKPVGLDRVPDRGVVHAELGRDGADAPVLGVEQAADARAGLGVRHRATSNIVSCRRSWNWPSPSSGSRWWRRLRPSTNLSVYSGSPAKSASQPSLSLVADEPSWSSTTTAARTGIPCHIASASSSVGTARGCCATDASRALSTVSFGPAVTRIRVSSLLESIATHSERMKSLLAARG